MSTPKWHKWLSDPGNIRVVALEATTLVHELCRPQHLEGLSQKGFGEAVVGALLIASTHKSNESVNLNAQGSGLLRQAIVDASPEGRVRGFLREQKDSSKHSFGADGLNGHWGSGVLSVLYTKNFEGKYPYTGMVPISTGLLDDAINEYYRDSEQLASKVGLFVELDGQQVRAAGGVLIQTLGGASEEESALIQKLNVKDLRRLAEQSSHADHLIIEVAKLLDGRVFKSVETKVVEAFCNCGQDRIERALVLTGEPDIREALGQDPYLTITCDFCRKEYRISAERIKSLFSTDPSRLQ
jgi:molecular chaperone Hsp33